MITTRHRTPGQWRELARRVEEGWRPATDAAWERLLRDFVHDVELATGTREILALAKFMVAVESEALRVRRERRADKKAEFFTRRIAAAGGS